MNTCSDKNVSFSMKTLHCIVNGSQCGLVDNRSSDKVTEFQKGTYCPHHFVWHITDECWEVDLQYVHPKESVVRILRWLRITFISTLESSPVHCANPRPWGKHCKAAKSGTAAILPQNQSPASCPPKSTNG